MKQLRPFVKIDCVPILPRTVKGKYPRFDGGCPLQFYRKVNSFQPKDDTVLDDRYDQLLEAYVKSPISDICAQSDNNLDIIREVSELLDVLRRNGYLKDYPADKLPLDHQLLGLLAKAIDFPDRTLINEIRQGFSMFGRKDPCPIFDTDFVRNFKPRLNLNEVARETIRIANTWNFDGKKLGTRISNAIIAEFKKLRDAGLADIVTLREFLDQSLDGAISTCFGVEQSEKIRCIHDFKKSCINACTTIYSKIQLQDLRHLRDLFDRFAKVIKFPCIWKADQTGAYRNLLILKEHQRFLAIAHENLVLLQHVLPFGMITSVISYLRFATLICCITISLLGVPACNYLDDFFGIVPAENFSGIGPKPSYGLRLYDNFAKLNATLGIELVAKKCQSPTTRTDLLGVIIEILGQELHMRADVKKVIRCLDMIAKAQKTGFMSIKEAQKCAGLLNFVASISKHRIGPVFLGPIYNIIGGASSIVTGELAVALEFWKLALPRLLDGDFPNCTVTARITPPRSKLIVWVDASPIFGGYVCVLAHQWSVIKFSSFFRIIFPRASANDHGAKEAFALLFSFACLYFIAAQSDCRILTDSHITFSAVAKGSNANTRAACAARCFWLMAAQNGANVLVNTVPGKLNFADLPSRPDIKYIDFLRENNVTFIKSDDTSECHVELSQIFYGLTPNNPYPTHSLLRVM